MLFILQKYKINNKRTKLIAYLLENVKVNAFNFESISAFIGKLKIQTEEQTYKQQQPGILF